MLAAAPYQQQLASRQPPAAATETAAAQGLTLFSKNFGGLQDDQTIANVSSVKL